MKKRKLLSPDIIDLTYCDDNESYLTHQHIWFPDSHQYSLTTNKYNILYKMAHAHNISANQFNDFLNGLFGGINIDDLDELISSIEINPTYTIIINMDVYNNFHENIKSKIRNSKTSSFCYTAS